MPQPQAVSCYTKHNLVPVGFLASCVAQYVLSLTGNHPGFHVANVHAVEAGYRQDRLHDALGILLSGFTVGQKPASPLTVATMPLSFSPLSGSESPGSISTTVGWAREILIRFAILAGAYYPRSLSPPSLCPSPSALSLRRGDRPAVVAVLLVKTPAACVKNTRRFVKSLLVIDKNFFFFAADDGNLWERDVHKTKQGFRGKTMRNKTRKKSHLALGMLLLASQATGGPAG